MVKLSIAIFAASVCSKCISRNDIVVCSGILLIVLIIQAARESGWFGRRLVSADVKSIAAVFLH